MDENIDYELLWDSIKRDEKWVFWAKYIVGKLIKRNTHLHIFMPDSTKDFIKNHDVVIYPSSHRSLWECVGIPYILSENGLPMPYMIMANTLVGKYLSMILNKVGAVPAIRKNNTFGEMRYAIDDLKGKGKSIILHDNPIGFFPDGRSKDGFQKPFRKTLIELAIELDTPLITTNVDYCDRINEEKRYIKDSSTYKFNIFHTPEWVFKYIGDICISFGEPIIPSELGLNRDLLAEYLRSKCLDQVRIPPKDVVANAIVQEDGSFEYNLKKVFYNIESVVEKLEPHREKFFNIDLTDSAKDLWVKAGLWKKDPKIIMIYHNEIDHYMKNDYKLIL